MRTALPCCPLFLFVPVLARRKARRKMSYKFEKNRSREDNGKRKRVRAVEDAVDFMRVEDAGQMPGLDPFELDVKKEMAALSKTPADELMSAEESRSEQVFKCAAFRMLKGLIRRRGFLPRRLRLAYELCYVSKLPDPEAAYLMGITPVYMRKVRQNLRQSLVRALQKKEQDELFLRKAKFLGLTRRQERIVRLRFCEGFSVEEISKMTGRSRSSVHDVVRRVRKKIFQV
jgi:DNA-directed RNA polymerase specialized sigma24 family protein